MYEIFMGIVLTILAFGMVFSIYLIKTRCRGVRFVVSSNNGNVREEYLNTIEDISLMKMLGCLAIIFEALAVCCYFQVEHMMLLGSIGAAVGVKYFVDFLNYKGLSDLGINFIINTYNLISVAIPVIIILKTGMIAMNVSTGLQDYSTFYYFDYILVIGGTIGIMIPIAMLRILDKEEYIAKNILIQMLIMVSSTLIYSLNSYFKDIVGLQGVYVVTTVTAFIILIKTDYNILKSNENSYKKKYAVLCIANLTSLILSFLGLDINIGPYKKGISITLVVVAVIYFIFTIIKASEDGKTLLKESLTFIVPIVSIILLVCNLSIEMQIVNILLINFGVCKLRKRITFEYVLFTITCMSAFATANKCFIILGTALILFLIIYIGIKTGSNMISTGIRDIREESNDRAIA